MVHEPIWRLEELDNPAEHLDDIARVHMHAFRKSVMTMLGKRAVRGYYNYQHKHQQQAVFIASYDGKTMAGFCVVGAFHDALYGYLSTYAAKIALALILRPHLWFSADVATAVRRGVQLIRWKHRSRQSEMSRSVDVPDESMRCKSIEDNDSLDYILSIAVDPAYQGGGIGRELMAYAERIALRRGKKALALSVREENKAAVAFYIGRGYAKLMKHGRWNGDMIKELHITYSDQ